MIEKNDSASDQSPVWLQQLRQGADAGVEAAFKKFVDHLTGIVRVIKKRKLANSVDSEAVVASVFESVVRAAREGRLATLESCDELLFWLLWAAKRKAVDHHRRETNEKSGGRFKRIPFDDSLRGLFDMSGKEATKELEEEIDHAAAKIKDETANRIFMRRLEGYTIDEIARDIELAPSTIKRKLKLIRDMILKEYGIDAC